MLDFQEYGKVDNYQNRAVHWWEAILKWVYCIVHIEWENLRGNKISMVYAIKCVSYVYPTETFNGEVSLLICF